jgi:hypothetical protein
MSSLVNRINRSQAPLNCRWVLFRKRSDFLRAGSWTRALCVRLPESPRIVTDDTCRDCRFWKPAEKPEG